MLPSDVLGAASRAPGGVLSLAELRALGYDRSRVARWVAAGLLGRPLPGLVAVATAPTDPLRDLVVAWRWLGRSSTGRPGAILTGQAGLALLAAEGFEDPGRPRFLVDRTRTVRLPRAWFDVRYVRLERIPHARVRGVDVADPAQLLADAALDPALRDRTLRVAFDDLRRRGLVGLVAALARWSAMPRHRGAQRMAAMAPALEQESEGERDLFALVSRYGPPPDCQVVVLERLRVDFLYASAAYVLEYYGDVHDGTVDHDASRVFALERAHLRVQVVTRSMLRHPDVLGPHVHDVRRERERLVLAGRLPPFVPPPQPPRRTPLRTIEPLR